MTHKVLSALFPLDTSRYFPPMKIGGSKESADRGASLILKGIKTTTSSMDWEYPDGKLPFEGALSVLLDGSDVPCAVVETSRVEIQKFSQVDKKFAYEYGEGDRTLNWWNTEIKEWYRQETTKRGLIFTKDIC